MKLIFDISAKTITPHDFDVADKNLYLGFTDEDGLPVHFDELSFGLSVKQGDAVLYEESFPENGVVYDSTDQDFLVGLFLDFIRLNESYVLSAWAVNAGATWQSDIDLLLPVPVKPFDSWLWDEVGEVWLPPVPYPWDGKIYEWNEDEQRWDEVNAE